MDANPEFEYNSSSHGFLPSAGEREFHRIDYKINTMIMIAYEYAQW